MDLLFGVADALEPPRPVFFDDPVGWVGEFVDFSGLTGYQAEVMSSLVGSGRVAVRGPHGLGKTTAAALLVHWFAQTRDGLDWKALTTAGAWRQLVKYLWPEVHKWSRRLRWDRLGRKPYTATELMGLSLKLSTGEAFAAAASDHEKIEGCHADHLLYVFDESKAIPVPTWDAAEGAFTGGSKEVLVLAISTPGEPQGRFYQIHKREAGYEDWTVRHVTRQEVTAAGRMDPKWAEQRSRQWGAQSALFLNRVEGEFASSDEDGVIPLSWVEAANERWSEAHPECLVKKAGRDEVPEYRHDGCLLDGFTGLGCDPARSGPDATVLGLRHGETITDIRRTRKEGTTQTSGRVRRVLEHQGGKAVVDVIGIGAGVVDSLRDNTHLARNVVPFNAAERSTRKDRSRELGFLNTRAAAWWHLRERLDPDSPDEPISLPPDDELIGDLTAPKWTVTGAGKIQIESKDDIRRRLSRSTDVGDAVVMAFWLDVVTTKTVFALPFGDTSRSYWRQAG